MVSRFDEFRKHKEPRVGDRETKNGFLTRHIRGDFAALFGRLTNLRGFDWQSKSSIMGGSCQTLISEGSE